MKRMIFSLLLIAGSFIAESQERYDIRLKNSFTLRQRKIEFIIDDTVNVQNNSTSLMTAGSIYKFVAARSAGNPNTVLTTGSYANPSWITSLAYSKLTDAPTIPALASGPFTSTATMVSNLSIATGQVGYYTRVGDVVVYNGSISLNITGSGSTSFRINLPVVSNFTFATNATGIANFNNANAGTLAPIISADATNDGITFTWNAVAATPATIYFVVTYRIL